MMRILGWAIGGVIVFYVCAYSIIGAYIWAWLSVNNPDPGDDDANL
jgi:hypothetical protein